MGDYKKLIAYQKAFALAIDIFNISKTFPVEEKYSLISQIRRSSRSVCANMAEAYKRRMYKDYFISKLNDAETENTETQVWLDFALAFNYIDNELHLELSNRNSEIGKLIWFMSNNPEKFMANKKVH